MPGSTFFTHTFCVGLQTRKGPNMALWTYVAMRLSTPDRRDITSGRPLGISECILLSSKCGFLTGEKPDINVLLHRETQIERKLRSCIAQVQASLTRLGLLVLLSVPVRMLAQTSVQPGTFGVKLSGFENLVGGGATFGRGGGAGRSTASESEATPQYKTPSPTARSAP